MEHVHDQLCCLSVWLKIDYFCMSIFKRCSYCCMLIFLLNLSGCSVTLRSCFSRTLTRTFTKYQHKERINEPFHHEPFVHVWWLPQLYIICGNICEIKHKKSGRQVRWSRSRQTFQLCRQVPLIYLLGPHISQGRFFLGRDRV